MAGSQSRQNIPPTPPHIYYCNIKLSWIILVCNWITIKLSKVHQSNPLTFQLILGKATRAIPHLSTNGMITRSKAGDKAATANAHCGFASGCDALEGRLLL